PNYISQNSITHLLLVFTSQLTLLLSSFSFNNTATTDIYTLSLHDALPISQGQSGYSASSGSEGIENGHAASTPNDADIGEQEILDRKSTRLNSCHSQISYAVFCLKKKKNN